MDPKNNQRLRDYARYSGLGFQMLAIILMAVYGGFRLDKWLQWKFPLFTLIGALGGVAMSLYFALKDLLRKK